MEDLLQKADNLQISIHAANQQRNAKPVIAQILQECLKDIEPSTTSNKCIEKAKHSEEIVSNTNALQQHKNRKFQNNLHATKALPVGELCYYHKKWKHNARSCIPGCSWNPKNVSAAHQLARK